MTLEMDMFAMLGIEVAENVTAAPVTVSTNKTSDKGKSVGKGASKAVSSKGASKKQSRPKAAAIRRYNTQEEIRKMPIPLSGWAVHYAMHSFDVEMLARKLVEMEDATFSEVQVREALWAMISDEVKEHILEARQPQTEEQAKGEEGSPAFTEEPEEQDVGSDLDVDDEELELDEEGIVKEKSAAPEANTSTSAPKAEKYDGDLTISMISQALAYDYFEFATEGAIEWRVDRENKRLLPYVGSGKFGNSSSMKQFFWKASAAENLPEKAPITIIAGRNGRLYDRRENPFMCVTAAARSIRELEEVSEGFQMKLPKIPGQFLSTTISFFKHFAKSHPVEVVVNVVWNLEEQKYELNCPLQVVSRDNAWPSYPALDEKKMIVVVIHSHHHYPAEFSPTDDRNDQAFCVYGIVGRISSTPLEFKFRAGFNGVHYDVPVSQLFDFTQQTYSDEFPAEWLELVTRAYTI